MSINKSVYLVESIVLIYVKQLQIIIATYNTTSINPQYLIMGASTIYIETRHKWSSETLLLVMLLIKRIYQVSCHGMEYDLLMEFIAGKLPDPQVYLHLSYSAVARLDKENHENTIPPINVHLDRYAWDKGDFIQETISWYLIFRYSKVTSFLHKQIFIFFETVWLRTTTDKLWV